MFLSGFNVHSYLFGLTVDGNDDIIELLVTCMHNLNPS